MQGRQRIGQMASTGRQACPTGAIDSPDRQDIVDNFKAAVRSLLSTPGPTLVVIATLALAIGANTAIFSIVNGVLLRPLGYGDDSRLVVLWATTGSAGSNLFRLSPADYRDMRDGAGAFDGQVALYRAIGSTLTGLDQPAQVGSLTVTARIFGVLDARPALGRFYTDEDEDPGSGKKVVITHASWTRRFGSDPDIIGSTIELDSIPYAVVAVTEQGFQFPPGDDDMELYFPMGLTDTILLERDHRMFDAIARLDDGVTLDSARAEISAMARQLAGEFPDTNEGWGMTAEPIRTELLGDLGPMLLVLSGAVFLVLLTACANIANVLVARSTSASREFAVRAALGARPRDLCVRSLAESLILGGVGGGVGVLLAFWGAAFLRSVMPAEIPRLGAIGVDGMVLSVAAALSVGATVLFGSLPALRSMAPDLHELLKPAGASGTATSAGQRLRELMVVVEVALAIVLLVGAGLMVRSFARLGQVDPGFRQDGVVSVAVKIPRSRYARSDFRPFFEQFVERVRQIPGIRKAGAVSDLPMSNVGLGLEMEFTVLGLEAADPTARPNAQIRLVIPGYFEVMGMEIISGRAFSQLDTSSDVLVGLVNETLVGRYFTDYDPIGRTVDILGIGKVEIVGVAADIRSGGLQSRYESEVFLPYGRIATQQMQVVAQSDMDTAAVARAMGDVLNDIDPQLRPAEVAAISDLLWESAAQPRFNTALLSGLAICAAILAVVGTYGIVSYSVAQRTSEIGVRMALGANAAATVLMIVRQALRIVVVGAALGVLGAVGATQFLTQLLFEVEPTDLVTYVAVLAAAVLVGVLAAWLPARRATRIDPVSALRHE